MRMTHAQMYARMLASDPAWNGRFFTGVMTTGIYCLPSCRARKPKPKNVRFFPTSEAAREAGLRPCRKCHPDDFARGADPVLETIETVVGEMRARPEAFKDARAVVRRSGFGTTRCFELFRQHFHATPADVLVRARITAARERLVGSEAPLMEIALSCGFESISVFHEHFRALNGMTPAAYRDLRRPGPFTLDVPAGYPLAHLRRTLARDPVSVTERLTGRTYEAAVDLGGEPALMAVRLTETAAEVTVGDGAASREQRVAAHRHAVGLLGLEQDA